MLALAGFGPLRSLIQTRGMRIGVGRFVAGETLDDALANIEGRDWYGYFSRRLAERPANLAFVVRGLFG
jgi:hypothetical protein